jgi:predicted RNA-binding protein with PUA-like domain
MAIWLLKTEPSNYSFDDLEHEGETVWDGVRNNAALKNLREMVEGDLALIYHTGDERSIVGTADIVRGSYADPKADDEKLAVCDVRVQKRLARPVTLAEIKARPELKDWDLVRLSRLSVVPVSEEQWEIVQKMAQETL